jgi:hypothetical protein
MTEARSWRDLVQEVEYDPWGRPYGIVMMKLRPCPPPPLTASIDLTLFANVIGTLFPRQDDDDVRDAQLSSTWSVEWKDEMDVTDDELLEATKRMASRDVAPDPDGIP